MKIQNTLQMGSRNAWTSLNLLKKSLIISGILITGIQSTLNAQEDQYTRGHLTKRIIKYVSANFSNYSE